jgi:hypothetical protein
MRSSAVLAAFLLAGCPTGGGECTLDVDCIDGDVCANNHVCLSPFAVHYVSIRWTIDGAAASAETCAAIGDLSITAEDSELEDSRTSWFPVPCTAGRFTADKLPVEYDRAIVTVDATGARYTADIPASGGDVVLDLAAN